MKHLNLSGAWKWGAEPFPAFRAEMVFGRNKRGQEFLPVQGVTPVTTYTVMGEGGVVLYSGSDGNAALKTKETYNAGVDQFNGKLEGYSASRKVHTEVRSTFPELPLNSFRVIKTKEQGTILVVAGEDTTNRCLLFIGATGGFRGGVSVLTDGTTGQVIKKCSAGNACESAVTVVALLDVGQSLAFQSWGRYGDSVVLYTWNGSTLENKNFNKSEWDSRKTVAGSGIEDAEVL